MKNMTVGNPLKLILMFAVPILMSNLFQQLYNMSDTIMIGRMLGVKSLAALGATFPVFFLILFIVMSFTAGLTVITAQYFGRKDYDTMRKSVATSIILSLILSIISTILMILFLPFMLNITNVPAELFDLTYSYLIIMCGFSFVMMMFNLLQAFLRAVGNSKGPFYFLVLSCLTNIFFNYVFIKYVGLGIAGSAYGTIVAVAISSIASIVYMYKKYSILKPNKEDWKFSWGFAKEHLKIAIPMCMQGLLISLSIFIFQRGCNEFGAEAIAAVAAANRIDNLGGNVLFSLGMALTTFVAQNYGCNRIARIRRGVNQVCIVSILVSIVLGVLIIIFKEDILSWFISDEELKAFPQVAIWAKQYLNVTACSYFFLGSIHLYRNALQGLGNGWMPLLSSIIELGFRMFAVFVLTNYVGFYGIILSNPLAWIGGAAVLWIGYYFEIKKLGTTVRLKL
ncbi:MAG: MATE family efflux transporter [Alphaproteobacteria bacterium]